MLKIILQLLNFFISVFLVGFYMVGILELKIPLSIWSFIITFTYIAGISSLFITIHKEIYKKIKGPENRMDNFLNN